MESNRFFEAFSVRVSRNIHWGVAGEAKHMHWFCGFLCFLAS